MDQLSTHSEKNQDAIRYMIARQNEAARLQQQQGGQVLQSPQWQSGGQMMPQLNNSRVSMPTSAALQRRVEGQYMPSPVQTASGPQMHGRLQPQQRQRAQIPAMAGPSEQPRGQSFVGQHQYQHQRPQHPQPQHPQPLTPAPAGQPQNRQIQQPRPSQPRLIYTGQEEWQIWRAAHAQFIGADEKDRDGAKWFVQNNPQIPPGLVQLAMARGLDPAVLYYVFSMGQDVLWRLEETRRYTEASGRVQTSAPAPMNTLRGHLMIMVSQLNDLLKKPIISELRQAIDLQMEKLAYLTKNNPQELEASFARHTRSAQPAQHVGQAQSAQGMRPAQSAQRTVPAQSAQRMGSAQQGGGLGISNNQVSQGRRILPPNQNSPAPNTATPQQHVQHSQDIPKPTIELDLDHDRTSATPAAQPNFPRRQNLSVSNLSVPNLSVPNTAAGQKRKRDRSPSDFNMNSENGQMAYARAAALRAGNPETRGDTTTVHDGDGLLFAYPAAPVQHSNMPASSVVSPIPMISQPPQQPISAAQVRLNAERDFQMKFPNATPSGKAAPPSGKARKTRLDGSSDTSSPAQENPNFDHELGPSPIPFPNHPQNPVAQPKAKRQRKTLAEPKRPNPRKSSSASTQGRTAMGMSQSPMQPQQQAIYHNQFSQQQQMQGQHGQGQQQIQGQQPIQGQQQIHGQQPIQGYYQQQSAFPHPNLHQTAQAQYAQQHQHQQQPQYQQLQQHLPQNAYPAIPSAPQNPQQAPRSNSQGSNSQSSANPFAPSPPEQSPAQFQAFVSAQQGQMSQHSTSPDSIFLYDQGPPPMRSQTSEDNSNDPVDDGDYPDGAYRDMYIEQGEEHRRSQEAERRSQEAERGSQFQRQERRSQEYRPRTTLVRLREAQQLEAQRLEAQRLEAQRQETERQESQRQESQTQESQPQESRRQETGSQEVQPQDTQSATAVETVTTTTPSTTADTTRPHAVTSTSPQGNTDDSSFEDFIRQLQEDQGQEFQRKETQRQERERQGSQRHGSQRQKTRPQVQPQEAQPTTASETVTATPSPTTASTTRPRAVTYTSPQGNVDDSSFEEFFDHDAYSQPSSNNTPTASGNTAQDTPAPAAPTSTDASEEDALMIELFGDDNFDDDVQAQPAQPAAQPQLHIPQGLDWGTDEQRGATLEMLQKTIDSVSYE